MRLEGFIKEYYPEWYGIQEYPAEKVAAFCKVAEKFCLVQKYAQSEVFRKELERSKGLFIVEQEANPRRRAGAWSAKPSEDGTTWIGPNIMGRLLMELRDKGTLPYSLPEDVMVFSDLA